MTVILKNWLSSITCFVILKSVKMHLHANHGIKDNPIGFFFSTKVVNCFWKIFNVYVNVLKISRQMLQQHFHACLCILCIFLWCYYESFLHTQEVLHFEFCNLLFLLARVKESQWTYWQYPSSFREMFDSFSKIEINATIGNYFQSLSYLGSLFLRFLPCVYLQSCQVLQRQFDSAIFNKNRQYNR